VAVESGNRARTLDLCEELDKHSPSALHSEILAPVLRGRVAIDQGNPGKAIQLLSPSLPTETAITDEFSVSSLYPAYVRGQAYLLSGDGKAAATEFQKLIGHPGLVLNTPLAHWLGCNSLAPMLSQENHRKLLAAIVNSWPYGKTLTETLPSWSKPRGIGSNAADDPR